MHALEILFLFFLQFKSVSTTIRLQNACFRDIVFKPLSAFPNHFKYRHSVYFKEIVFICSLHVPIVSNNVRMHAFETLFAQNVCISETFQKNACFGDIVFMFSRQFQNCFKYRQDACFRDIVVKIFCISQSFQILSECMLLRHCLQQYSAFHKHFN